MSDMTIKQAEKMTYDFNRDKRKSEECKLPVDNIVVKPLIKDEDIEKLINNIDEVARNVDQYDFGLPIMFNKTELIDCFKEWYKAL